jgi:hypothetical protein
MLGPKGVVAVKCHYCEREATYHVTLIEGGVARTVDACTEHTQQPELELGVRRPPKCPVCGEWMDSRTVRAVSFEVVRVCPTCRHMGEGK